MLNKFGFFFASEKGATSIEYALISSMIILAIILSVSNLGGALINFFQSVPQLFPERIQARERCK